MDKNFEGRGTTLHKSWVKDGNKKKFPPESNLRTSEIRKRKSYKKRIKKQQTGVHRVSKKKIDLSKTKRGKEREKKRERISWGGARGPGISGGVRLGGEGKDSNN